MNSYSFVKHNKQAILTKDLFISFPYKLKRSIYRMPYKNRFTREETMYYIFEEYLRQVLLDIIENNTIFAYNCHNHDITLTKESVTDEKFMEYYRQGRFDLDYLKSNFTGHFLVLRMNKVNGNLKYKNVFLSGDLKSKRDKASEVW